MHVVVVPASCLSSFSVKGCNSRTVQSNSSIKIWCRLNKRSLQEEEEQEDSLSQRLSLDSKEEKNFSPPRSSSLHLILSTSSSTSSQGMQEMLPKITPCVFLTSSSLFNEEPGEDMQSFRWLCLRTRRVTQDVPLSFLHSCCCLWVGRSSCTRTPKERKTSIKLFPSSSPSPSHFLTLHLLLDYQDSVSLIVMM